MNSRERVIRAIEQTGPELIAWVISFLIVAFTVFLLVRGMNRLRVKKEEAPAEPPKPREEVVLLKAILQTLRKQ